VSPTLGLVRFIVLLQVSFWWSSNAARLPRFVALQITLVFVVGNTAGFAPLGLPSVYLAAVDAVDVQVSRRLERELNEAKAQLAEWDTLADVHHNVQPGDGSGEEKPPSPSSIREHIQYLQKEWDDAEVRISTVTVERDALLAACKEVVPNSVSEWAELGVQNPIAIACHITYGEAIKLRDAIAKVETGAGA